MMVDENNPKKNERFRVLPNDPDAEGCQGKINYNKCRDLYSMIFKAIDHAKMYYDQYRIDSKQCTSLIENIRLQ